LFTFGVEVRILIELRFAAFGTEKVLLSLVFALAGGFVLIDLHFADRIYRFGHGSTPWMKKSRPCRRADSYFTPRERMWLPSKRQIAWPV
jgi:hypothetical protein